MSVDIFSSSEEKPMHPSAYREILDHLGLVAGMFDELSIGEVIDRAAQQDPEQRIVTLGNAVKAMVLKGLGFVNQQLYLVPMFFRNKPTQRLIAPGIDATHLNDDTLGGPWIPSTPMGSLNSTRSLRPPLPNASG
jgi:Domain of unknown function (DUF4277)